MYVEISADKIRYDSEHWPGLYIRFAEDSPAIMAFTTGKYNIAGAKSIDELKNSNEDFLSVMNGLGLSFENPDFEIRNLVFLEKYDKELDVEAVAIGLGLENTELEPE